MNVSTLLTDEAKQVLTEQSLLAIETALAEKIELTVEAALVQQDELYAEKLQQLVRAIDKDHTTKLSRVVEAIDGCPWFVKLCHYVDEKRFKRFE